MKFIINNQNELLNHIYQQNNIRIIDGMAHNNKCIIICSSNGVYFPDTFEEFRLKIICNNYFEGGRLASLLVDYVERIILIRDIRKNYYVTGISEKYCSIDSVLDVLKELTEGYDVVTTGVSAGGYMATIIGSNLGAKYVISAGGQWNLYENGGDVENYYFLRTNKDNDDYNKYFDLSKILKSNKVPVFYMYGGLNSLDIQQIKCAEGIDNVYPVAIKSPNHAQGVSTESYLRLLCADVKNIIDIYDINKGGMVDIDKLEEQINRLIELPKGFKPVWATSNEQKDRAYTELMYEWIKGYQDGGSYIHADVGSKVSIWGKGRYCDLLMNELKKQGVEVKCIVETQPLFEMYEGIPIVSVNDIPDDVDTIIVVPYYDMKSIKEKVYESCGNVKVIGIDQYIREGNLVIASNG